MKKIITIILLISSLGNCFCENISFKVLPKYLLNQYNNICITTRKYFSENTYEETKYLITAKTNKKSVNIVIDGINSESETRQNKFLPEELYINDFINKNPVKIIMDDNCQIIDSNISILLADFEQSLNKNDSEYTISRASQIKLIYSKYNEIITSIIYKNLFGKILKVGSNSFTTEVSNNTLVEDIIVVKNNSEYNIKDKGILKDNSNEEVAGFIQEMNIDANTNECINFTYTFETKNLQYNTKIVTFYTLLK